MSRRLCQIGWAALIVSVAFPLQGAAPSFEGYGSPSQVAARRMPCEAPPIRTQGKSVNFGSGACIGTPDGCTLAF
jgi:hypothetical protein